MKKIYSVISLICIIVLLISGCGKQIESKPKDSPLTEITSSAVTTPEIDINSMDFEFTDNDLKTSYNDQQVTLVDEGQDIVKITKDGIFKVTGKHSQIVVDAPDTAKPHIILENANITSSNGPAIFISKADKVFITLPSDSESSITDSESYDESYVNADGVIFSKADLTINGNGKLNVNAKFKCGIVSKDDLVICDSQLSVKSIGSAIEGKDCVKLKDTKITTNAGTDGIKSTNAEDSSKGFIYVDSGEYNVTSQNDAFQAQTALIIEKGKFNLKTGGGSAVSSTDYGKKDNRWGMWGGGFEQQNGSSTETTESAKALKSANLIKIVDGEFIIDSSDDAIHSNSDAEINGGTFDISSGDDGIHADDQLIINNGTILIKKSYEGIEATAITVKNGNIDVTSTDDGFNAAGGNDSSAMGGRPGQNPFESDSDAQINLDGGYILVNASGDGIDSNGSITMKGGTLLVSGPENSGNGSLDYGSTAIINGGIAVITGASGMATTFDSSSKQPSFMYNTDTSFSGGTQVSVSSDDKVLASFLPAKQFSNIIVSTPDFKTGETYKINLGGTVSNADKNGFTNNGKVTNPDKTYELELTSNSTSNSGGMVQMGPGGGKGNMRPDGGKRPW